MALRLSSHLLDMYQKVRPENTANMFITCANHAQKRCPKHARDIRKSILNDTYIALWICINPWTGLKQRHPYQTFGRFTPDGPPFSPAVGGGSFVHSHMF